jgi:uncharacterized repeat protein (TIGR04052 family)
MMIGGRVPGRRARIRHGALGRFALAVGTSPALLLGVGCATASELSTQGSQTEAPPDAAVVLPAATATSGAEDDSGLASRSVRGDAGFEMGPGAQPITVEVVAKLGASDFACGESVQGITVAPALVTPRDLRLFVHDVRLVTRAGAEVPLVLDERLPWQGGGVALLDFEDASGDCFGGTPGTNTIVTGTVPAGEYRGLVFTNGVPEAINHADPATAPAPLRAGGMSWGWLLGYKFMVVELGTTLQDFDGGAGDVATTSALLHLGSTACDGNPGAGTIVCAHANRNQVRLDGFEPGNDRVVLDVAAIFSGRGLDVETLCHSSGPECEALLSNIGIDPTDGTATEQQQIYWLE